MDPLSPFFDQFALSARVFFSGTLCGLSDDHATGTTGYLHVLRQGTLKMIHPPNPPKTVESPTVLFFPRPCRHTFQADLVAGAQVLCSYVEFGAGMLNPLVRALPEVLIVPLNSVEGLNATVDLLFAEAFSQRAGRQAALDRLAEYFIVLLLRSAMEARLFTGGILVALADPRLAGAVTAMHAEPERAWTLEALARIAGMSRARFAAYFREVVGATPFDYLASWRIGVAQGLLKKGEPLKLVAPSVGYASSAALTRAFYQHVGASPTDWLARVGT